MAAIAERSHAATLTLRAALARPVSVTKPASPVPPGGYRPTPFGVDRHSFIPISERGLLLANSLLRSTAGVAAARASRSKLSARSARRRDRGWGGEPAHRELELTQFGGHFFHGRYPQSAACSRQSSSYVANSNLRSCS